MQAYVALLRAVNVGGHAKVGMAELRALAVRLGLAAPRTLLQTGNLLFEAEASRGELERRISEGLVAEFGLRTLVIVRSRADWSAIVAGNPYPEMAREDPSHLLVAPLEAAPEAGAEAKLRAAIKGRERVSIVGDTAYLAYPDGIGRSKLTSAVIGRHLGVAGTGRNWTTALKIAAAFDD